MADSTLDLRKMAALLPDGVRRGSDLTGIVIGTVTGLDVTAGQVQVSVAGSEPVWVPAAPFIYEDGAPVRIRRSPLDGGRLEYCEGPITPAPMYVTGRVTAVSSTSLTVTVLGQSYVLVPRAAGTYAVGNDVWVERHPTGFGVPQAVLGVSGVASEGNNPGGGSGNPGQTVARQATISPADSGTWSDRFGRWDSWNPSSYGGKSTLWQGNAYGSGQLHGWAGYGDRVVGLNAVAITGMWIDVIRSGSTDSAGRAAVVQGSPDGTRPGGAPSGSGDTASTSPLAREQGQRIQLPTSTYESWRTGGFKGIRLVGGDYGGFYGTARGDGMALTVQFTVVA